MRPSPFTIRRASYPEDSEQLLDMWLALYTWATDRPAERESMRAWFDRKDAATFVAFDSENPDFLVGYADVGERSIVDGCESSPAAFFEAWYVKPEWRRRGVGKQLVDACVAWAKEQGYAEMGSDALLDNIESHRLHKKFGFEETDRVVQFRRSL